MDKTNKTKNLAYCALFTALIAVGAFIRVPVPVVPFTLQYLFTMLAGLLLGPRLGTIAVGTYVLLGLVGLPIFTQGGGFWYVFQPSFGYLIGFCVGTFVTGWLAQRLEQLQSQLVQLKQGPLSGPGENLSTAAARAMKGAVS